MGKWAAAGILCILGVVILGCISRPRLSLSISGSDSMASNSTKPKGLRISILNEGRNPFKGSIIVRVPEGIHLNSSELNTTVSFDEGAWTYSFDAELPPGLNEYSFDYRPDIPAKEMTEGVYKYNITVGMLDSRGEGMGEFSTEWRVFERD